LAEGLLCSTSSDKMHPHEHCRWQHACAQLASTAQLYHAQQHPGDHSTAQQYPALAYKPLATWMQHTGNCDACAARSVAAVSSLAGPWADMTTSLSNAPCPCHSTTLIPIVPLVAPMVVCEMCGWPCAHGPDLHASFYLSPATNTTKQPATDTNPGPEY
jgi:hypothetical protein